MKSPKFKSLRSKSSSGSTEALPMAWMLLTAYCTQATIYRASRTASAHPNAASPTAWTPGESGRWMGMNVAWLDVTTKDRIPVLADEQAVFPPPYPHAPSNMFTERRSLNGGDMTVYISVFVKVMEEAVNLFHSAVAYSATTKRMANNKRITDIIYKRGRERGLLIFIFKIIMLIKNVPCFF